MAFAAKGQAEQDIDVRPLDQSVQIGRINDCCVASQEK